MGLWFPPRRNLIGLFLTIVFAVSAVAAFSEKTRAENTRPENTRPENTDKEDSSDAAPIQLISRPDLPPYILDSAKSGIEIDIVKAVFLQAGQAVEFIQMPNSRLVPTFESGRFDGVLTQNINLRAKHCATNWYFNHPNVGITLSSQGIELARLEQLSEHSVLSFTGARGYLGVRYRAAVINSPHYVEAMFQENHISLLYQRRYDVVVGDEWILRQGQKDHFKRTGMYEAVQTHRILDPLYFVVHFRVKEQCERFDEALAAVRASGAYDAILERYHRNIATLSAP